MHETPALRLETPTARGVYARLTVPMVARAMSLQDFNPRSRTFGCCDRPYWHYKTLAGFPAATMQQLALPFAILHATPFHGNPYHDDRAMLDRAVAAMRFWCRCQHRTGSFDEWYRHEYSYCATAFTAFGMSECLILLKDRLAPAVFDEVRSHVLSACDSLAERFNAEVMNQNLAACAALWNVFRLTDDARWRGALETKWGATLDHADGEGWFREYGGADLGYCTLALDLLACLDRRGCDLDLFAPAERLCRFIASFACGSGGFAESLGSRGTEHAFPFGLDSFADRIPAAATAAIHLRRGYLEDRLPTPASVDDRYFAYFYLPQFALACTMPAEEPPAPSGSAECAAACWPSSGFRIWGGPQGTVVCSLRRQGGFNLYAPGLPVHTNLGYWIETRDRRRFTSAAWNEGAIDAEESPDIGGEPDRPSCRVRGRFARVDDALPLAGGSVLFRFFSERVLRFPRLGEWFQSWLKQWKIMRRDAAPLTFERRLVWKEGELLVSDVIQAQGGCPSLRAVGPVADIEVHSPSAKLSAAGGRTAVSIDDAAAARLAETLNAARSLRLQTRYCPDDAGMLRLASFQIANAEDGP